MGTQAAMDSATTLGIGILGSAGRMGQAIAQIIGTAPGLRLAGVDQPEAGADSHGAHPPRVPLLPLAQSCDVLIDFSGPALLADNLSAAVAAGKPMIIGTTGLEAEHHAAIGEAAGTVPVLWSANMSMGVNLLAALVQDAAARLGAEWDIEIVEMHHRHKVDSPSGTALLLGEAAAAGRGIKLASSSERGRDGISSGRAPGAIGFASLRGGSVAGDHQVIFAAEGERIELGHRAEGRTLFAQGAVRAARWIVDKPAGRYTMADVLGL
jgi:4-hydroxy-tetrahydrodipicolinate reductase